MSRGQLYINSSKKSTVMWGAAHPCAILNAVDVELHGDVKAVEEISPKHQCVLWGVNGMNPPWNTQDTGCWRHVFVQTVFLRILHACTCHGSIIAANLMGLWRCCPAWALSSGSHDTCHPRRCLPAFLIKPSSRTSPGSVVWVESAKTPGSKIER